MIKKIKRIIRRMVKLFRMWRLVRLVDKENRSIGYKDPFLVGFYEDEPLKFVTVNEVISKFKVFTRDEDKREYITRRTIKSALKNKYLNPHRNGSLELLEVNPGKGEDFIDMWIVGFIRELIVKEWKFVILIPPIVAAIAGYVAGRYN